MRKVAPSIIICIGAAFAVGIDISGAERLAPHIAKIVIVIGFLTLAALLYRDRKRNA